MAAPCFDPAVRCFMYVSYAGRSSIPCALVANRTKQVAESCQRRRAISRVAEWFECLSCPRMRAARGDQSGPSRAQHRGKVRHQTTTLDTGRQSDPMLPTGRSVDRHRKIDALEHPGAPE